ncbi:MAG: glucose 1-dehydrogenase [Candidatus Binatia bacterium]|nr:glucose 1-dehydrogenase [Candidatus Binatia bacterium]
MAGRLAGKVALISGAARGMGECEARLFAREGARVVLGDILEEQGQQVAREIVQQGGAATFVRLDVTVEADWQRAVAVAEQTYGKLDILVNNAGIVRMAPLEETSLEAWHEVINVNQTGVFLGMKYAVPAMRRAGGGSIINISSIAGMIGLPNIPAYQASKGAVRLLTKHAAIQYAKDGIRVNSVHPGRIETPMTANLAPERREMVLRLTPMGRDGKPEEVAYGVLYLASDEASFVTGAELVIDGGYTAQ